MSWFMCLICLFAGLFLIDAILTVRAIFVLPVEAWNERRRKAKAAKRNLQKTVALMRYHNATAKPPKSVCAWCQSHISGDPAAHSISHSICSHCTEIQLRKFHSLAPQ